MPHVHRPNVLVLPSRPIVSGARWSAFCKRLHDLGPRALLQRRVDIRFEERLRERERIARELHDTLLQGAQALLLSLQAIAARTRPDDPMRVALTEALRRADEVLAEARDRIQDLRGSASRVVDLAESLATAWRDLAGEKQFRMDVEGSPRALNPGVGDEIAGVGREALTNALRHSGAGVIEVQVVFEEERLRLFVRDDGVGFAAGNSSGGTQAGHWGLLGMRERARLMGAQLEIWSARGAGTEIALSVPAASAYRAPTCRH